ncbi:MAG: HAMP domain-containing histidine kinase [Clostridia bacterium]|nr:HAMP domain-containing histidine kinase [Clostridia bacterium]
MGKNKMKKRITIEKEFISSYVIVLILSIITSIAAVMSFYLIFHSVKGFHSSDIKRANMTEIIEYAHRNSSFIINGKRIDELNNLADTHNLSFLIKDAANNVVYSSGKENISIDHDGFLTNMIHEIRSTLINSSTVDIPLMHPDTGKVQQILVLTQKSNSYSILFILIDISIPFICFITFTLIVSRKLSRRIKTPLRELMDAVEKIKGRDLDFTIENRQSNEIGDLARAFEEMKANLKTSLLREWQLEHDRREMVSAITHDLRTPLAIIQGHIEALQDGMKENRDKLDAYLNTIEQNAKRAKNLIDEMNLLVEIDSMDFTLSPSPLDLVQFMKNRVQEYEVLAEQKDIRIVKRISDNRKENSMTAVDPSRLSQVLDNIMSNSLRYTPKGGTISVNLEILETEAHFRICDTGAGFSEKDLSNLFKKFYKGDASRSVVKGHCGLGLYISKSIIQKHGGAVRACNMPEGGACIEFSITF